ncbi:MAG: aminopeptidase N [Bdellovibrionaceae bacterium]|nr:aminopeptidase N [Pseudobdellovibrionaceae bacterium]
MEPTRVYLKDYQPPGFEVKHIDLHFDLREDFVVVTNQMSLRRLKTGSLELDGVQLKLRSLELRTTSSGVQLLGASDYRIEKDKLILDHLPEEFELKIVTEIKPQENASLEGLYKSGSIFCTQCEAQGFRKITYFLDRPDVMTSYTVTIEADERKYPQLLSNGDKIHQKILGEGRHQVVWRDPHKKPSYLFALVAGDLGVIQDHYKTTSGREVLLEIFAPHGQQSRCYHAMSSLKKSMKWDEERFGCEYDLNNFMIVAIDDFNGGAMENKGLNIFNSRLIMADPTIATDADYRSIESVVAHEYFHNWTGNRVTLRDWFQLSLKEGLTVFRDQEFSADVGDRGLQRIEDVDSLRSRQFSEDAGPNAHPVRPESCLSVDNFYTATIYEKGAELIRMMQILTGRLGFRKGMDNYFNKFDGQAVTTDDFAQAISEVNGLDFSQFKLWYQQFGTPKIEVLDEYDSNREEYRLTLKQSIAKTEKQPEPRPFHIPVLLGLLDRQGKEITLPADEVSFNTDQEAVLHLKRMEETFVFKHQKAKPIPSLFREFSAPVEVLWEAPLEDLLVLMQKDRDGFNRREMAQQIYLRVLNDLMKGASKVPASLLKVLKEVLQDQKIDAGFKAALMTWPSDAMILQTLKTLDVSALRLAREGFQTQVAVACESQLRALYLDLHKEPFLTEISTRAFGVRNLKARVLAILQSLPESDGNGDSSGVLALIETQYYQSKNMTDRLAALALLVDSKHVTAKRAALENFRLEFEKDSLVLNKWFAVQAQSSQDETYDEVQGLIQHPLFQGQNPNHIYSLMRTFGNNILQFHDPAKDCYRFYLDFIEKLDAKNPQVAARLCGAFNLFKKLAPESRSKLLNEVRRVLMNTSLSRNTRELLQGLAEA